MRDNENTNQSKCGKVYLIGAGPGDPGLFTVKGSEILKKANTVVYDRLVSPRILELIPKDAKKIYVGKCAGNHSVSQDKINEILLSEAKCGGLTVRLKGGDPFLFGRGGEELELLVKNNIAFEVVPGVTSAISAAAYGGIPVTHRKYGSSLHIMTGHRKENGALELDYEALNRLGGTLVFLMSSASISEIRDGLLNAGMGAHMPAAVIENGTLSFQRKWVSTLDNIAEAIKADKIKSPSIFIVGEVCSLSENFDWFSEKPLKGIRVLVAGQEKTAGRLSDLISREGGEVTNKPCIKTVPLDFILDLKAPNWLLFTSKVGVNCFFEKLSLMGFDSRALYGKKIGSIGAQTDRELRKYGISSDFIPSKFDSNHLAGELVLSGKLKVNEKVSVFRAKKGTEDLIDILKKNDIDVLDVPVYETVYIKGNSMGTESFDYVAFTSSSTVTGLLEGTEDSIKCKNLKAICIGRKTEEAAQKFGMKTVASKEATLESMVFALCQDVAYNRKVIK